MGEDVLKLPKGYRYAAGYAGIRKQERNDVGLIVSDGPAQAAGVFTTNVVQAAPVKLAMRHLETTQGRAQAILVNAGNANCATRTGAAVALETVRATARALKIPVSTVLPASTGVIGVEMDGGRIVKLLPELIGGLAPERFEDVAQAMMTTDTVSKTASEEVELAGGIVRVAGMTKGSGMIHPNMATTLGFVMTDAAIEASHLRRMLKAGVDRSYNRLTVDGDMSTNDTMIVMANGASGVRPRPGERKVIGELVGWVMEELAEQIARDGEGARKLIIVRVLGARNDSEAAKIARAIANSPLVKTAVAGSDPNWGRILSAAGASGVVFDPRKADIDLQRVAVCRGGVAAEFSEAEMKKKLDADECRIRFTIRGGGQGQARFWSCDFTEKYIEINASYRT